MGYNYPNYPPDPNSSQYPNPNYPPPAPIAERAVDQRTNRLMLWIGLGVGIPFLCLCLTCLSVTYILEVSNPVGLLASIVMALLPGFIWIVLILRLDRFEREPGWLLLVVFLWGFAVATVLALIVNTTFGLVAMLAVGSGFGDLLTAVVSAPIVEESTKGLAVLLVFIILRDEFDNVLDGIIYGSIVGMGFAISENVIYFGRAFAEGSAQGGVGSGVFAIGTLAIVRAIFGGLGHALYTGTTGAGLGYAREAKPGPLQWLVPIGCFLLAILQHAAWNLTATIVGVLTQGIDPLIELFVVVPLLVLFLSVPAALTLFLVAVFAWRREARVIREQLRDEVVNGVVSPEHYEILPSTRLRRRALWRAFSQGGYGRWKRLRALFQIETELAFRKWHLSRGEKPKGWQRDATEDRYRQQIVALRAQMGV